MAGSRHFFCCLGPRGAGLVPTAFGITIFDLWNSQSVMHIVVRNGGLRTRCSGGRAGCPWCAAGVPGGLGGQIIDLGSSWGSCRGQPVVCQPVPGGVGGGGRRDHWCRPVSAPCSGRGRCAAPDRGLAIIIPRLVDYRVRVDLIINY